LTNRLNNFTLEPLIDNYLYQSIYDAVKNIYSDQINSLSQSINLYEQSKTMTNEELQKIKNNILYQQKQICSKWINKYKINFLKDSDKLKVKEIIRK
jgi:hypothetical protein